MILGITERTRLPRLGKIRLGEKAEAASGKMYPKALNHFNFKDAPGLAETYGNNAQEIFPVYLPSDDEEVSMPTARKAYRATGLFCACSNGVTATRVFVGEDRDGLGRLEAIGWKRSQGAKPSYERDGIMLSEGSMYELECPADECYYAANKFCRGIGRLFIVVPRVNPLGVYEITTTSKNSIKNILGAMRYIKTVGLSVTIVPFALKLSPYKAQAEGKSKEVWVLELEARPTADDLKKVGRLPAIIDAPEEIPDDLMPGAGAELSKALKV